MSATDLRTTSASSWIHQHAARLETLVLVAAGLGLLAMVAALGVDVPNYDEWGLMRNVLAAREHGFWAIQPFAQVNDSRPAVFKLLVAATITLFRGWHPLSHMYLNAAMIVATLGVLVSAVRSMFAATTERLLLVIAIAVTVAGPIHHENLLWGIGFVSLLPVWLLASSLWLTERAGRWSWLAALLCATIATCSYAHGFLLFAFALPWWRWPVRRERTLALVTGVVALTCAVVFLISIDLRSHAATSQGLGGSPLAAIGPFLAAVSSSLIGGVAWPVLYKAGGIIGSLGSTLLLGAFRGVGALLLFLFGVATVRLRKVAPEELWPWLLFGAFGFATALAIGVGRSAEGPAQAFSSRYASMTVGITVTTLVLCVRARIAPRLLLTLAILAGLGNTAASIVVARSWNDVRRAGRDSLTFVDTCGALPATIAIWPTFDRAVAAQAIGGGLVPLPWATGQPPQDAKPTSSISVAWREPNWQTPSFLKDSTRIVDVGGAMPDGVPVLIGLRRDEAFHCLGAGRGGDAILGGFVGVAPGPGTLEAWTFDRRGWTLFGAAPVNTP